jgi:aspartate aminotransferase
MIIDPVITESKTLQFSLKAQELKKQGRDIISLGLGEPEYDTPEHVKRAAADALAGGMTRYSSAQGLLPLRQAVARKLQHDNSIPATADELLITPGAKNALFLASAAVLHPEDEVINLTPCYVSNLPILKLAEPHVVVKQVPLSSHDFRIDRERFLAALSERARLLVTNYPNNPSGKLLDADDAEFLRNVVRERQMYWLSDEIYERLLLTEKPHLSPASFADIRHKVITVGGFSKSYSMTGWRIGYVHACASITKAMLNIHQQLNTNTAAFIQMAALAALTGPQDRLHQFIADLKSRAALVADFAVKIPSVSCSSIDGGLFGFLHIGESGLTSDAFCTELLDQTGVALIPGVSFGGDFDHWVRISLCVPTDQLREGLQRIGQFLDQRRRISRNARQAA